MLLENEGIKMEEKKEKEIKKEEQNEVTEQKTDTSLKQPEAQVIGEIPKEKQKGVFGLIIFFAILFGVTFGLPYIKDYIDNKNAPITGESEEKEENNEQEQTPEEQLVYYEIDPNTNFTFNDLNFSALNKESSDDYYLNVTIQNTTNSVVDLNDNYYFELYTAEKTLVERVKIISDKNISSNETINLKLLISEASYNNATNLTIDQKTEEDFQEVTLNGAVEDGYNVIACNNKGRNIKYYFKETSLEKISDIFEYTNPDANAYSENLRKYTTEASSLNNIEGISSNIVDTSSSFTMNTQVDLTQVKTNNLPSSYYFAKGTNPKVVKFEMSAMRFNCD